MAIQNSYSDGIVQQAQDAVASIKADASCVTEQGLWLAEAELGANIEHTTQMLNMYLQFLCFLSSSMLRILLMVCKACVLDI